jgi:hypothetical protein
MSNHNLFTPTVTLNKETHSYRDTNGNRYIGFNEFYKNLIEPFDSDMISGRVAKSRGVSKESVLKEWSDIAKQSTDKGTAIDIGIKGYMNGETDKYHEFADVCKEYENYHKNISDVVVYSEKYKVATEIDLTCLISNRKDAWFDLTDFKSNERTGIEFTSKYRKWLKAPFDHLPDTNYTKTAFQLAYGAYLLEELTGRRCRRLFIHYVPADNIKAHQIIPVMYMKNDLIKALDLYRSGLEDSVRTIQPVIF